MNIRKLEAILAEVKEERCSQHLKWGVQNHEPTEWLAILGEEHGEVCRAVCEFTFNADEIAKASDAEENYRKELIQLAAVAIQMVECYDRKKNEHQSV